MRLPRRALAAALFAVATTTSSPGSGREAATAGRVPAGYADAAAYRTVNEAVAAALIQHLRGIYLPAGVTVVAHPGIVLPPGFAVIGGDPRRSVVRFVGAAAASADGFKVDRGAGNRFEDFTIGADAPPAEGPGRTALVHIRHSAYIAVRRVTFVNPPQIALAIEGSSHGLIDRNRTLGGRAIHLRIDGTDMTVTNNTIEGGEWYGISLSGSGDRVTRNRITGLLGKAAYGMQISGLANSLIWDNEIDNVEHYGIHGEGNTTHDNAIIHNVVRAIGTVNGRIVDQSGTGINLWPGAYHNLIANNMLPNEQGYGVCIAGKNGARGGRDSPGNIVSGNVILDSDDPGITVTGASHTIVRNNLVSTHASVALGIGDENDDPKDQVTNSDYSVVINNTLPDNMLEGIYVSGVSHGIFIGNDLRYNGAKPYRDHFRAGMTIKSNAHNGYSTDNLIEDNRVTGQQVGIYIAPGQRGNRVLFNVLYPNLRGGLRDDARDGGKPAADNQTTADTLPLRRAPPLADAGEVEIVGQGQIARLTGKALSMPGSDRRVSYTWQQIAGPPVRLNNPHSPTPAFRVPVTGTPEILGFRLTVANANGTSWDVAYVAVDPASSF